VTDQAPDQQALTPTSRWLALVADWMPPEEGPAGTAERILLLLHYGIDWTDGWVSRYRKTYWQHILPERVISATYGSENLRQFWQLISTELGWTYRNMAELTELERLLRADSIPVLETLQTQCYPLLLRTRLVARAVAAARAEQTGLDEELALADAVVA